MVLVSRANRSRELIAAVSGFTQEGRRNFLPFRIEAGAAFRLLRAPVPIAGVSKIPFLPVQIRMNPGACRIVDVLCDFVRGVPVTFRIVPKRAEWRREIGGRLFFCSCTSEVG